MNAELKFKDFIAPLLEPLGFVVRDGAGDDGLYITSASTGNFVAAVGNVRMRPKGKARATLIIAQEYAWMRSALDNYIANYGDAALHGA